MSTNWKEYFSSDLSDQVINGFKTAADLLKRRGAKLVSISLPTTETCLGAYYVIASAEASSNLARYSGLHYGYRSPTDSPSPPGNAATGCAPQQLYASTRSHAFGSQVKRRLLLGAYALSASGMQNYFFQAQKVRLQVRTEFDRSFRLPNVLMSNPSTEDSQGGPQRLPEEEEAAVDVIMTPVTLDVAPSLPGSDDAVRDGWSQDRLLVPASLAGLPALVLPVSQRQHLPPPQNQKLGGPGPVGVQLISQWGTEPILFLVASVLERAQHSAR